MKNSCSSITTQCIKTRLVPLHWPGPVHLTDTSIVGLMCSWGCPHRQLRKFTVLLLREKPTQHLTTTCNQGSFSKNIKRTATRSCCSPKVQKLCQELLQRRNRKRCPKIHDLHLVIECFELLQIQWSQPSLNVFVWYNQLSDYWLCPTTDCLLYMPAECRLSSSKWLFGRLHAG